MWSSWWSSSWRGWSRTSRQMWRRGLNESATWFKSTCITTRWRGSNSSWVPVSSQSHRQKRPPWQTSMKFCPSACSFLLHTSNQPSQGWTCQGQGGFSSLRSSKYKGFCLWDKNTIRFSCWMDSYIRICDEASEKKMSSATFHFA